MKNFLLCVFYLDAYYTYRPLKHIKWEFSTKYGTECMQDLIAQ